VGQVCNVLIFITNTRPDEININTCHIEWISGVDDWTAVKTIFIKANEDFRDDGEKSMPVLVEKIVSPAEYYNGVDPADIMVQTKSRPTAVCTSTTDPQYNTFDGSNFLWNGVGTINLWTADYRDWEVQTRVSGRTNCGVAIRDGCNTLVFDRCSGDFVSFSDIKDASNQPKVEVTNGNTYFITSRRSGASIKLINQFKIERTGSWSCGWSGCGIYTFSYKRIDWFDIYSYAPGADFGKVDNSALADSSPLNKWRTSGICGSFNGVRTDDSTNGLDYQIPTGATLFDAAGRAKSTCNAVKVPVAQNYERCRYTIPVPPIPVLTVLDVEDITDLLALYHDVNDQRQTYDFKPVSLPETGLPAVTPLQESFCANAVQGIPTYKNCLQLG